MTGVATPTRRPLGVSIVATPHRVQGELTADQLAQAAGISSARLAHLVRLGLVEPATPGAAWYRAETAARLRRMLRLRADLRVNLIGAAIIVDLLERLDRIERELARGRAGG